MFKNVAPKWYIGVTILFIAMVFLLLLAEPMQASWGMGGVALTQIGLLLVALAAPFLYKWKLSEILPIQKVTFKQFFGTLILYIATFIPVTTSTMIVAYFFPGILEVGSSLGNFFVTVPFIVALFIVAVMPAICEEVLFRGVFLYTLRKFNSEFSVILTVAIFFGLFHLNIYRFIPTAILGFAMTYLMIKTKNFLLPMLFHFLNNVISLSASYATFSSVEEIDVTVTLGLEFIGVYLILSAVAPVLYYFAGRLLTTAGKNNKKLIISIFLSILLLIIGFGILAAVIASGSIDYDFYGL